jgi:hypothetical protein
MKTNFLFSLLLISFIILSQCKNLKKITNNKSNQFWDKLLGNVKTAASGIADKAKETLLGQGKQQVEKIISDVTSKGKSILG